MIHHPSCTVKWKFRIEQWFAIAFKGGSVVPKIFPLASLCGGFGAVVSLLYALGWPLSLPILTKVLPSVVLGMLLVFRTNTANERHWEGRKHWGTIVNTVRNLSRQIWIAVEEEGGTRLANQKQRESKIAALRLLVAFAIATKLHLRQQPVTAELQPLLSPIQYEALQAAPHPPLKLAFWLEDYLQEQHKLGKIHIYQLTYADALVDQLMDAVGGCERILKTPIPPAYATYLRQLILLYCLLLPFGLVTHLRLWTGVVVLLICLILFGIEAVGVEIEDPFGQDVNDLPLDSICATIQQNIADLILSPPGHTLTELTQNEPGAEQYI
uniref:Bestrophin-like protein n=1 Tax=Cyanothece sp. (strain PCC 7425 / ATCC 29141) TaxID=395961 RepID=B8HU16_CYAP4